MVPCSLALLLSGCRNEVTGRVPSVVDARSASAAIASRAAPRVPEEKAERGRLFLAAGRGVFASGRDVELGGNVHAPPRSVLVESSVVTLSRRATGDVVMEARDAFHLAAGERTGAMSSNGGPELPADLPDGDYRVVWRVNDMVSNVLSLRIDHAFQVARAAPLVIALLEGADGRRDPAQILVELTNVGASAIDLPSALGGAVLIVDGVEHPRTAPLVWGGSSSLQPGRSWGTIEDLAGYGVPSGAHRVAMRMAGATSAAIDVEGGSPSRSPR
jgi:hypothetical protein